MFKKNRSIFSIAVIFLQLQTLTYADAPSAKQLALTIKKAIKIQPTVIENDVVRVSYPRNEVAVNVNGVLLKPAAGLTSWAAFKPINNGVMVMGDTVVFEDEITPAMDAAIANRLNITALHNHFIFDDPPVYFMHIGGSGKAEKMANSVKAVWDAIRKQRQEFPKPKRMLSDSGFTYKDNFDVKTLEKLMESPAKVQDGVVKFTFSRKGQMDGVEVGGSMGLTTWAAFSGSQDMAVVSGDFIMTSEEVQPVIHMLRKHNIQVVALHNHMIDEKPVFYFLHFWGKGKANILAKGIKESLTRQKTISLNNDITAGYITKDIERLHKPIY
ncbi:DUF1259 domain-containing protein [Legionella israelensis]|uniref:DUF1259 domain-containing protein n=1 Tax=Legionella israelensis TaxID=454 RepID=UPI00117EF7D4|nr:DUF1259 domain-containing protein [Legionella israelensis]QDP71229.1 DUF1259 domain-containing protein [Legionella israelensis]